MSYEGDGIKLGDLAGGSSNPISFMHAFHVFRSRFGNRETSRHSRKSYEFVPRLSSALRLLTPQQRTTMVSVLRIIRHPGYPGYPITFPIRTHHKDRKCSRTCHRPVSIFCFLIFEQGQRRIYSEVLIPGDLSPEDVDRAVAQLGASQVCRVYMCFGLLALTPCQGLWSNMDLTYTWQKPARYYGVHLRQPNCLLRPTEGVPICSWRFWGWHF